MKNKTKRKRCKNFINTKLIEFAANSVALKYRRRLDISSKYHPPFDVNIPAKNHLPNLIFQVDRFKMFPVFVYDCNKVFAQRMKKKKK